MRFEKPHSLSYHESTLQKVPSMTRVSSESKIDENLEETAAQRTKSRPADRKIEQVVAQLVRTLTSKREVTNKDLEVVLEVTKTKIVEAVNAQAITIFFAEEDGIHFRHIYQPFKLRLYAGV